MYNPSNSIAITTKTESFHKLSNKQFPVANSLFIPTQRKSDTQFLRDNSERMLNYRERKPSRSVLATNTELRNSLENNTPQSHSRHHAKIQVGRNRHIKNMDKKILHFARKLSPPCKDGNLQDKVIDPSIQLNTLELSRQPL